MLSELTVLYAQPACVTSLVVTAATQDSITLEFAASPNAIAYQTSFAPVEPDGALGDTVIATTGVGSLDVTVTGLISRQLYRFSIQAANKHAAGYGAAATIDVEVEGHPARPQLRISGSGIQDELAEGRR